MSRRRKKRARPDITDSSATGVTIDLGRWGWRVIWVCIGVEALLFILDYTVNYSRGADSDAIRRLFNTTNEEGLASWFAITQTLMVGLTLWVITLARKAESKPGKRWLGWCFLAIFFTYLAVDDGARIHERVGTAYGPDRTTSVVADNPELQVVHPDSEPPKRFFPSYGWQALFMPVFSVIALFMLWFLWIELGRMPWRLMVIGALACLALAVGLDFIEGLDERHPWNVYVWIIDRYDIIEFTEIHFDSLPYATVQHFSKSIEECLEMAGMTLFWGVFLQYLGRLGCDLRLRSFAAEDSHPQKNA
jgi:hypothetical protein